MRGCRGQRARRGAWARRHDSLLHTLALCQAPLPTLLAIAERRETGVRPLAGTKKAVDAPDKAAHDMVRVLSWWRAASRRRSCAHQKWHRHETSRQIAQSQIIPSQIVPGQIAQSQIITGQ